MLVPSYEVVSGENRTKEKIDGVTSNKEQIQFPEIIIDFECLSD